VPALDVAAAALPPPPPPRLAFEVGGSVRDAVEVAMYQTVRVRVLAIEEDGTASDVTELATLATSDPLTVSVAAPGLLTAQPRAGSATIAAALAGHVGAASAVTVAPRHCAPVVDAVGPAGVRVANPCTIGYVVEGWRVAHRGPAADGPGRRSPRSRASWPGRDEARRRTGRGAERRRRAGRGVGARDFRLDAVGFGDLAAGHPFAEGAPAQAMAAGAVLSRRDSWDTGVNAADLAPAGGGL
jgi:hypothetical protein